MASTTSSPVPLGVESGHRLCSTSPSGPNSRYRRSHLCPVCREIPNSAHSSVRLLPFRTAHSTNWSFKLMARCSFQGIHPLNTVSDVLTLLCQRCPGTAPVSGLVVVTSIRGDVDVHDFSNTSPSPTTSPTTDH